LLKLSERPIKSGHFNLGIRKGVFTHFGRQLIAVSPALSLQQEQQHRLHKSVEVPHGAAARMLLSVTRTGAIGHYLFSS
jgi:hypothetical protein